MATPTIFADVAARVKINGKNLYELGMLTYTVPHLGGGPMNLQPVSFPERHEAYGFQSTFAPRPFVISGTILADTATKLRTNLDLLKGFLRPSRGKLFSMPTKIRLELADQTDRYWPCVYPGGLTILPIPDTPTVAKRASFMLPLLQLTPFSEAVTPTGLTPVADGANNTFTVMDTGTAPCPFLVELDEATAPDFVISNCSFYWDCDYSMVATKVDGTTVIGTSGQNPDSDAFEPGDYAKGRYSQLDAWDTTFAGIITNKDEGTVILNVRPQFNHDDSANVEWFFDWFIGNDNGVRITYQGSDDKFYFSRERATATVAAGGDGEAQTFDSDTEMVLVGSWGPDGIKIYKDGALLDTSDTTTGVVGTSGTIYLGDAAGGARGNIKYEHVIMLPYQLTDEQVEHISAVPEDFRHTSVKKSKAGNLTAGQRCILDFGDFTIKKVAADLITTNDLGNWDTNGFLALQPPAMVFHCPASETVAGIKVRYRKRWM